MNKLIILAMICFMVLPILAASTQETYDYRYVLELYNLKEDYLAKKEIGRFQNIYPDSEYKNKVDFITANIDLRNSDYESSKLIYKSLLTKIIPFELKSDILLNYAIACYYTSQFQESDYLLQRLLTEIEIPYYTMSANLWKGRILYDRGQYLSAEQAFRKALIIEPNNLEVQTQLMRCLYRMNKEKDALPYYINLTSSKSTKDYAIELYLTYLIDNFRLTDVDNFIAYTPIVPETATDPIKKLLARKLLLQGKYQSVIQLTNSLKVTDANGFFIKAIAYNEIGESTKADSIFSSIISSNNSDLAVLSYLERLKILFNRDPNSAIKQLTTYINSSDESVRKGEQFILLGFFYHKQGSYLNSLLALSSARNYDLTLELVDKMNIMTADNLFLLEKYEQAQSAYSRYLKLNNNGLYKDKAWFFNGLISYLNKDYNLAKISFERIKTDYPNSIYMDQALFYEAEIHFYIANYQTAIDLYKSILPRNNNKDNIYYRLSQSYYYTSDYSTAQEYLNKIKAKEYAVYLLQASIYFNQKKYTEALSYYQKSIASTKDSTLIKEAQSYQALVYYQLKRFKEASDLYFKLSGEVGSPDTYLYLSAKSAFQAKDFNHALQLYQKFQETYPESNNLLRVLNDVANVYYNMGNIALANNTWMQIVTRFADKYPLTDNDITFLTEIVNGLELGLKMDQSGDIVLQISNLSDECKSDYLRFELRFMLLKVYSNTQQWSALYSKALEIRNLYPQKQRTDIELLMTESLINLNEYTKADSIFSSLSTVDQSPQVLNQWAKLDLLMEDYDAAFDKFKKAYLTQKDTETWLQLLTLSRSYFNDEFESLWSDSPSFQIVPSEAKVQRMWYFSDISNYSAADSVANSILNEDTNPKAHAEAFMAQAEIAFRTADYSNAIRGFNKLILLFPDFPDLVNDAHYYSVKAMLESGQTAEAGSYYFRIRDLLTDDQQSDIETYFNTRIETNE